MTQAGLACGPFKLVPLGSETRPYGDLQGDWLHKKQRATRRPPFFRMLANGADQFAALVAGFSTAALSPVAGAAVAA